MTIDYSPEGMGDDPILYDVGKDITFALGAGNYLPDLHTAVAKMEVGESVTSVMDAGFGEKNPELLVTVPKSSQNGLDTSSIKVGTELMLANGMKCKVSEVTDDAFTIDANPPMAGVKIIADVTLHKVEAGPGDAKYLYSSAVPEDGSTYEVATFALGCFWGGELAFMREAGVVSSKVGYTQGAAPAPTYKDVCAGTTGHTEGIQIVYDPARVSYRRLVQLAMHRLGDNVYKLNQVGGDRGTQYRHGVYYHNDEQKKVAQEILASFGDACVTECLPAVKFWDAEDYHQQYLLKGGQNAKKSAEETIRCYG